MANVSVYGCDFGFQGYFYKACRDAAANGQGIIIVLDHSNGMWWETVTGGTPQDVNNDAFLTTVDNVVTTLAAEIESLPASQTVPFIVMHREDGSEILETNAGQIAAASQAGTGLGAIFNPFLARALGTEFPNSQGWDANSALTLANTYIQANPASSYRILFFVGSDGADFYTVEGELPVANPYADFSAIKTTVQAAGAVIEVYPVNLALDFSENEDPTIIEQLATSGTYTLVNEQGPFNLNLGSPVSTIVTHNGEPVTQSGVIVTAS